MNGTALTRDVVEIPEEPTHREHQTDIELGPSVTAPEKPLDPERDDVNASSAPPTVMEMDFGPRPDEGKIARTAASDDAMELVNRFETNWKDSWPRYPGRESLMTLIGDHLQEGRSLMEAQDEILTRLQSLEQDLTHRDMFGWWAQYRQLVTGIQGRVVKLFETNPDGPHRVGILEDEAGNAVRFTVWNKQVNGYESLNHHGESVVHYRPHFQEGDMIQLDEVQAQTYRGGKPAVQTSRHSDVSVVERVDAPTYDEESGQNQDGIFAPAARKENRSIVITEDGGDDEQVEE